MILFVIVSLSVIMPTSVEFSTAQSPTATHQSSNIGLIIGVIVTLVIIVVVNFIFIISVILILAHYRRRNRSFEIKYIQYTYTPNENSINCI